MAGFVGANLVEFKLALLTIADLPLDPTSVVPIYRQIAEFLAGRIECGAMQTGEKLPATRELAGQLGLNRTTVSAAYGLLEEAGLISGQVGRGSFVALRTGPGLEIPLSASRVPINFASSRPAADAFPLGSFRKLAKEVIDGPEAAEILQLGSPQGYAPLRRYLLENDWQRGTASDADDVMVTNGCQQALDLLAHGFAHRQAGSDSPVVLVENPVYHGLLRVFERVGARLVPMPVGDSGLDLAVAENLIERYRPRLLVVTPDFQNPTGVTLPLSSRRRLLDAASRSGVLVVENGIYSQLRYTGEAIPSLKQLDQSGSCILIRSYSKVSFPGLRVGWITASKDIIKRLTEEKQVADLHSDQLAQAIFLRFAQSGELENHIARTCIAGRKRLETAFRACEQSWPEATTWTRPEGGMSFWVDLPETLTADVLLRRARREGVEFLPGSNFSVLGAHRHSLRISFGGLSPDLIERGIHILGSAASAEISQHEDTFHMEPAVALV